VLAITTRARQRLREISEEAAPETGVQDDVAGIRLRLSGVGNGSHDIQCRFGVDHAQTGDQVEDIGGARLLIDQSTFAYLRRTSAILDLLLVDSEEDLVLIVEAP